MEWFAKGCRVSDDYDEDELLLEPVPDFARPLQNSALESQNPPCCCPSGNATGTCLQPKIERQDAAERCWGLCIPCESSTGKGHSVSTTPILDDEAAPVTRGTKGLAYDADRVVDDRLRSRLLRNRASAERSRQRRKGEKKDAEELTERLEGECMALREENVTLRRHLELLQVSESCFRASKLPFLFASRVWYRHRATTQGRV